ncbi:hypothetical protein DJFAAGMI_01196 [Comamonas sp. PE63]|uniref:Uncharacterized protein n=1 Tax=Comamonas brasiliensis TaxID=1812482 RepID=A0ABS5LPP6_9BURK|nr:hypothetical protein [Comamonas sp. PE63]
MISRSLHVNIGPIAQRLCLISATVSPVDTPHFIGMMLIK